MVTMLEMVAMVCDVILALPPLCGCWMPFRSVMRWDGGHCRRGIRLRVDQHGGFMEKFKMRDGMVVLLGGCGPKA